MAATGLACIQLVEPFRGVGLTASAPREQPVPCVNWSPPPPCPHELLYEEFAEGGHGRAAFGVELDAEERIAAGLDRRDEAPALAVGRHSQGLKESGQPTVRREGCGTNTVLIIEKDGAGRRHVVAEFGGEAAIKAAAGCCPCPAHFGHVGIMCVELWQWPAQPTYNDH